MSETLSEIDICLISAGLPSSNPRLVKEAQGLSAAGFSVHCVVGDYPTPLRDFDAELIRGAGATMTRVGLGTKGSYKLRRAVQEAASMLSRAVRSERLLVHAVSPQCLRLFRAAAAVSAKLYLGHTLPALPAAVLAARRRGSIAGFDAEDIHSGESDDVRRNQIAAAVESQFLHQCSHLTTSSPLIAEEYARRYGLRFATVLNCFDSVAFPDKRWESGPLKLYWFSQTVGPGRGLEAAIAGAALATATVQLSFRGSVSDSYRDHLVRHARSNGLRTDLEFLPPEHPDQMIPAAAAHDVGLAIELREPLNHDLCLANKIFTYLAAGIPQILSRTAGQELLARELGPATRLVDLEDPRTIAAAIDEFATPDNYNQAARAARLLHETRYSWRAESQHLVDSVTRVLKSSKSVVDKTSGSTLANSVVIEGASR